MTLTVQSEGGTYGCAGGLEENVRSPDMLVCLHSDGFAIDSIPKDEINEISGTDFTFFGDDSLRCGTSANRRGDKFVCEGRTADVQEVERIRP